jgi:hypothetical protein
MALGALVLVGGASATVIGTGVAGASTARPAATSKPHIPAGLSKWLSAHRSQIERVVVSISAQTIGISTQNLVSALHSGQSIAEVAAANGVSAEAVNNALVSAADAEVSKAEAANKITATQAATIEGKLPGYVAELVNHVFGSKSARSSVRSAA